MPFITQKERADLARGDEPSTPGQKCYEFYLNMVIAWRKNPRWSTAHDIFKQMVDGIEIDFDDTIARNLAWQVFFQIHVMPFELDKRASNGDI